MTRIRLGIVGPGGVFWKHHFPQWCRLQDEFEIAAVLAPRRPTHQALADIWWTNDARDFFQSGCFDAVDICSPVHAHRAHILQALAHNKWVIVEKPVVGSRGDLQALRDLSPEAQGRIFVAENFRYMPSLQALYQRVQYDAHDALFVQLHNLRLLARDHPHCQTGWRRNPVHEGGMLLDGGVHLISVLRWFFPTAGVVACETWKTNPCLGGPDAAMGMFAAKPAVRGVFKIGYGLMDDDPVIITVHSPHAVYRCSKQSLHIVSRDGEERIPFREDGDFHAECDAFRSLIRDGVTPSYSVAEALADVEYTLATFAQAGGGLSADTHSGSRVENI